VIIILRTPLVQTPIVRYHILPNKEELGVLHLQLQPGIIIFVFRNGSTIMMGLHREGVVKLTL